jgi:hypothetical protein
MTDFTGQIQRIRDKLQEAKKADKDLKVFGAERHKYIINPPASESDISEFEKKYHIQLPECYKAFITQVGNGGISYANSAAGPYYGIYPPGTNIDDLICDNAEIYLKDDCVIYPEMTDEYWNSLKKNIYVKDISDEEFERKSAGIYGGILPVGSQGCTFIHGIVLNGPWKGHVVNLDMNGAKPQFAWENNFLDWYERWLDEVISGELIRETPAWFGYNKAEEEIKVSRPGYWTFLPGAGI